MYSPSVVFLFQCEQPLVVSVAVSPEGFVPSCQDNFLGVRLETVAKTGTKQPTAA